MEIRTLKLKKGREFSVTNRHPWIFSGGLENIPSDISAGSPVNILSSEGKCVGFGHFFNRDIAIKIASFQQVTDETLLIRDRIQEALKTRASLGLFPLTSENSGVRLFNSEGDGFPGLIIDLFNTTAVVEPHSAAIVRLFSKIKSILLELIPSLTFVFLKTDVPSSDFDTLPPETVIKEHNVAYLVDVVNGQKTGFFLDQRDNRLLLSSLCSEKSVLNTFCYSGGFTLSALLGNASHVTSVDTSQKALELLQRNLLLNGLSDRHQSINADCFDYLAQDSTMHDIIVLDPPALVKLRKAKNNAIKGYRRLNESAMRRLHPSGLLLTFSCSGHISLEEFIDVVRQAGSNVKKHIRVLKILGPGLDHPWSIAHAEGRYLKGLLIEVS